MSDATLENAVPQARITRCPTCGKSTRWDKNISRPFCSDRCKQIDLGAWALERYRVPGAHAARGDDLISHSE